MTFLFPKSDESDIILAMAIVRYLYYYEISSPGNVN